MRRKGMRLLAVMAAVALLSGCSSKPEEAASTTGSGTAVVEEQSQGDTGENSAEEKPAEDSTEEKPAENSTEEKPVEAVVEEPEEEGIQIPESCYLEARAVPEGYGVMSGRTAAELVADMRAGWNLGNTMDAKGGETAWGNPTTTKEMIDAIAAKGFDVIRIPTTWGQFTQNEAGEYKVRTTWLERVGEVVDYAIENDMYVILNTHHEGEWLVPNKKKIDEGEEKFLAIWTQVATYFADYGDHLIFEGLNEPRVEGGPNEWNGGVKENRDIITRLENEFMEVVRSTGGNNATRLLLVTPEAACCADDALRAVEIPEGDDYVAVSLHAYTPYDFTFSHSGDYDTWDGSHMGDLTWLFGQFDKYFLNKGIPVIVTEFGAVRKGSESDNNDAEVVKWIKDYITMAEERGVPAVIWDNGITNGNGERFGYFNRRNLTWDRESIVDAWMEIAE